MNSGLWSWKVKTLEKLELEDGGELSVGATRGRACHCRLTPHAPAIAIELLRGLSSLLPRTCIVKAGNVADRG
jgi:hypothetical protein